jgi:hypothetical protein
VFEATVEELTHVANEEGEVEEVALTEEIVLGALNAVAETVFPHRALETQKQWMRRGLKKPKELSFRKTVAAVGRLNNSIPYFPRGSEVDKFSREEIVELLEWSIPQTWRTKFDLDGYTPTMHTKERMITECEQIERNEGLQKSLIKNHPSASTKTTVHKKGKGNKYKREGTKSYSAEKKDFYCKEHGKNPTHNTDACFTLKNRANKETNASSHLTKKSFRREINLLARKKPRAKVIEMFATILQAERTKLNNYKKAKNASKSKTSDSESDESEDEIHVMDTDDGQTIVEGPEADEEQTYLKKIENLGTIVIE